MNHKKNLWRNPSRGTFYLFPMFLPLAEVAAWLIGLMGMAAGVAGFSLPVFWKRHRSKIFVAAGICLAVAAAITLYTMPDKTLRSNGTRAIAEKDFAQAVVTGAVPQAAPAGPFAAFQLLWTKNYTEQILSTPVASGDMLVYGTLGQGALKNTIEAVSQKDGAKIWTIEQNEPVFTMTPGPGHTVYAGEGLHHSRTAMLTAIDTKNARIEWARIFMGHIEENAAIDAANANLWTCSGPGGLWALDSRDGSVRWHQKLGHIDAKPLVRDGILYVPAQVDEDIPETTFFAVDAARGTQRWTLKLEGQPWGSPVLSRDGTVILSTTGRGQIGVEKNTDMGLAQGISRQGRLLWQTPLPGMALQPSHYVASNDIVIHSTKNGFITALKAADGTKLWQAKAGTELQAPATLFEIRGKPFIAAISYDGFFSIRDALTGKEMHRWVVARYGTASPVIAGDVIYVAGARSLSAFGGLNTLVRP